MATRNYFSTGIFISLLVVAIGGVLMASAFGAEPSALSKQFVGDNNVQASSLTIYEENHPWIGYDGDWDIKDCSPCSNGALALDMQGTGTATFTFFGNSISWIGTRSNFAGKSNVYVDGVFKRTVDQYSKERSVGQELFKTSWLLSGEHMIEIEASGQKNNSSRGYFVDIDNFTVNIPQGSTNGELKIDSIDTSMYQGKLDLSVFITDDNGIEVKEAMVWLTKIEARKNSGSDLKDVTAHGCKVIDCVTYTDDDGEATFINIPVKGPSSGDPVEEIVFEMSVQKLGYVGITGGLVYTVN